jgi:uncharacterized protein YtpQ (UPF0354 family)
MDKNPEIPPQENEIRYSNQFYDIERLPFLPYQKEIILEYLAQKLWAILRKTNLMEDHCKSYDPLLIDKTTAHSYVFDMEDGGRHHTFKDYKHLEKMLMDETIAKINNNLNSPCEDCDCGE